MADPMSGLSCPKGMVLISPEIDGDSFQLDPFCINETEIPQKDYNTFVDSNNKTAKEHPCKLSLKTTYLLEIIITTGFVKEETLGGKKDQLTRELADLESKGMVKSYTWVDDPYYTNEAKLELVIIYPEGHKLSTMGSESECLEKLAQWQKAGMVASYRLEKISERTISNNDCIPGIGVMPKGFPRSVGPDKPAFGMFRDEAMYYCAKIYPNGSLPSEKQWNAACGEGPFCTKSGELNHKEAIYDRKGPADVGSTIPNENGVYDMTGNVFEWLRDQHTDVWPLMVGGVWELKAEQAEYFTTVRSAGFQLVMSRPDLFGFRCVSAPIKTK